MSAAGKNLERIHDAVCAHDSSCNWPATAVLLNPFEHERLGWDEISVGGRKVPIEADSRVGTGRLIVTCAGDGYEAEVSEAVEALGIEVEVPATTGT